MEAILLKRLSMFADEIKVLTTKSRSLCNKLSKDDIELARIMTAKLQTILNRFNTELYNYFNISQSPDSDNISELTTIQLNGEETMAELNEKIKIKGDSLSTTVLEKTCSNMSTRLPKLELPQFTGDVLEWHQFWDQFSSNIDMKDLHDVDKLLYLKASLQGEAKKTIEGLDTTNKNYNLAVLSLKERFGKESQIIDAHYSALYKIKSAESITDYRKTLDDIERHLRVLNSLGEDMNHNHLRFLIMEKFPEDIIYEMKLKIQTNSIEEIRKQLDIIISAKKDARKMKNTTNDVDSYTVETLHVQDGAEKFKVPNDNGSIYKTSTSTLFNMDNKQFKRKCEPNPTHAGKTDNKRLRNSCIFCEEAHYNDQCNNATTLEARRSKLGNRCYSCFRLGHRAGKCRAKITCAHCGKHHNRALCPDHLCIKPKETSTFHVMEKGFTALQTAVTQVKGQSGESMKCRILLDSGSQRSYVTEKVARILNLPIEEECRLTIFTFVSKIPQELESPLVKLIIETNTNQTKILFANVVSTISEGVPYPENRLATWKHKERFILADDGSLSDQVDILIGNDYYYSLMSTEKVQIGENLFLIESELGWIISGITKRKAVDELSTLTYFQSACKVRLNQPDPPLDSGNLKMLWDLESIGITDSPKINRDEEALKHYNENTKYENNRYHVGWPWNEYPPDLPSNFGLAYGRLVNLLKRLDSVTLQAYDKTLKDQLEKGIIELVPNKGKVDHPVHYLPHHGVSAPGKSIRIVYDASSKTKDNKSLNQCLYCGPMLLEDLTGLLIKFRCHNIGISADVEKAFLQIALQDRDRDVTRFLWLKDMTKPATEENLQHIRFTRVPFGVISSPFLLNATIKHHLSKSGVESVNQIASDIYVDNVVTGTKTTQEAVALYAKLKEAFQQISMNLREWSSNSKEFLQHVPDSCPDKIVKILGLDWQLEKDTLQLRMKNMNNADTKRGILRSVASIYDPCGYTVPYLLPAKLLLQDLWKMKAKWDAPLSTEMTDKWRKIQDELEEIKEIRLPRYYMNNTQSNVCQLHCFTDSSEKVYAAVVYVVQGDNKNIVIGKSRLVPIKDQDDLKIPRLELLGVLIGSRLLQYVHKFILYNVTRQYLWTDSQIVIDWYHSNKLLTPFVARRVEEIKRNQNLNIRYIPSGLNPADVATRPTKSKEERKQWLSGPEFLLREASTWPVNSPRDISLLVGEGLPNASRIKERNDLPNGSRTEERNGLPNGSGIEERNQEIMEVDNHEEDNTLETIKILQLKYANEVQGKETSLSRNLGLFKDVDEILRCKGRLKFAEWSFDKRYPILIPRDCDFTNKIISEIHEKNYHVGVNHTLSLIRNNYWIPQGKRQVQKILKNCPRCVKHGGGPYKLPPTPALPPERVNFSMPFTFTGVDYLGPVLVKTENGSSKRWICLFTCLAVRAIHLEVVQDLTAEEGLLALRRMISTRGLPALVTSDNALHFKLIAEILADTYCIENKIRWRFIPELAPWFGGFYERLVGLVKHCMKRTLQKHLLKDSQLTTIIKEIEAVLNSRPLTCVDSELVEVLKPSDFLSIGRCITMETNHKDPLVQGTTTKVDLIKSWKRHRVILEEFKDIFCNQYLASLRERYNHANKEPRVTSKESPKIGQIVQIKADKNRESWKVGKIVSLVPGTDGLCRIARVKVGNTILTRSIAHLYPLEAEETNYEHSDSKFESKTVPKSGQRLNVKLPEGVINPFDVVEEERLDPLPIPSGNNHVEETENSTKTDNCTMIKQSPNNIDIGTDLEDVRVNSDPSKELVAKGESREDKPKRDAAVRALERIKEWTHNLMTTLL